MDNSIRPMKSLFVSPWYPTAFDPVAGVFVREHAKAVALYDEVVVLHLATAREGVGGPWALHREADPGLTEGLTTYRMWCGRWPLTNTAAFVSTLGLLRAFRHIVAEGFRPDIIHANVHSVALPSVLIGTLSRVPVVITEHSSAFPQRLLTARDVWRARAAFAGADVVMPVSEALRRGIEAYGIRASFVCIPNVVNTTLFYPDARRPGDGQVRRLLFVGLMPASHVKGFPHLLRALRRLEDQWSEWRLDVVGDGPARLEYEAAAAALGLADKITFHGIQPKAVVAGLMRCADVFLLPSLWENLPCVLIEAVASGLPIVATRVGGIPEIVDESVGVLVPPGDAEALTNAILSVIESLDEFDRSEIASRAARYSPETVGRAIHEVYEACVHKGRA